ncbi:hypothetical protein BC826DRAFT_981266 [Russula brevipes]|nr:hypothetical protein BC826DRAFT_981266 [Russula brevipes]
MSKCTVLYFWVGAAKSYVIIIAKTAKAEYGSEDRCAERGIDAINQRWLSYQSRQADFCPGPPPPGRLEIRSAPL